MAYGVQQARMARAVQAVQEQGVDVWISYAREMDYAGDAFLRAILPMNLFGSVAVLVTASGEKIVLTRRLEAEELEDSGLFTQIVVYDGEISIELADVLKRLSPKKIALNFSNKDYTADGLTYTGFRILEHAFQEAGFCGEIVSAERLMKLVRGKKSPEEVEGIRFAVQEAMKIFEEARGQMRLGMSGMDVQRLFQRLTDERHYGYSWSKYGNPFNSIGTKTSYLCKRPASDVVIEPGDVINVDFGISVNDFSSDNQRTFYALRPGEDVPPPEVQKAFDTLGRVNEAVISGMRPGVNSYDLLERANSILRAAGYPESRGGFGHEIGLYAHDGVLAPASRSCEPEVSAELLEGMTFAVEPAIITSFGRVCREEVAVVTRDGGRFLSTPQPEIWLIQKV